MFLDGEIDPEHGAKHPTSILLVEDMATTRDLILAILRRMGHTADAVPDAERAHIALQSNSYDLIIMDLHLPGEDGIAVAQGFSDHARVVLATGDDRQDIRERAIAAGCSDVLIKPLGPKALASIIEDCTTAMTR